ncbi:ABC transporter permease [uncultured Corynebacterium sp.]|uniref:ABC transporter permease n=1 Tax=uncultured Corynebacterium sp. TaxID=159447 RepID=UPI0025969320|nr:ABC transporter permease [uncultured Corynebacterium sp.]
MNALISESRKLFSLRSTWIYLAVVSAGMAAGAVLLAWANDFNGTVDGKFEAVDVSISGSLAIVVMVFAAAMMVGGDQSNGTVSWSYLSSNRRVGIVLSQFFIITFSLLLAATLGMVVATLLITAFGGDFNFDSFMHWPDNNGFILAYVEWTVFILLATSLAYLLRSGALAAMILVAEYFVIETALDAVSAPWAKAILRVLPDANAWGLVMGANRSGDEQSRAGAAVILIVMILLTVGGACAVARRRSVAK